MVDLRVRGKLTTWCLDCTGGRRGGLVLGSSTGACKEKADKYTLNPEVSMQGQGLISSAGAGSPEEDVHRGEKIDESASSSGASTSTAYDQARYTHTNHKILRILTFAQPTARYCRRGQTCIKDTGHACGN